MIIPVDEKWIKNRRPSRSMKMAAKQVATTWKNAPDSDGAASAFME